MSEEWLAQEFCKRLNWKKKARQKVLAGFSGHHERQEAFRETEIKELRAKIGELVIERDFLSKAFGR